MFEIIRLMEDILSLSQTYENFFNDNINEIEWPNFVNNAFKASHRTVYLQKMNHINKFEWTLKIKK